jgi:predicted DsbA family dithiol-disulfide isomerase
MMCDLEAGVCGVVEDEVIQAIDLNAVAKKVTLYYVTDPICSHCWALEPVLNRLVAEYGPCLEVQLVMGGLLPGWNGFSDGGNGIQKPSDVAGHWREVGDHSRMPIDGSLWHTNPVQSSYPPSRVFKVIQSKEQGKEIEFLRRTREAGFAFNQNVGEDEILVDIVNRMGLDGKQIVEEAALDSAQDLLEEDFEMAARLQARGFPTLVMVNEGNKGVKIVGARSLETYIDALKQVAPDSKPRKVPSLKKLLADGNTLFAKEIEVMYDLAPSEVKAYIESELNEDSYRIQSVLNELYIEKV